MIFRKVSRGVRNAQRLQEIVTVFFEEGFDFLVKKAGLGHCTSLRCRIRCWWHRTWCKVMAAEMEPLPDRLKRALIRLGPTFVKLGQVLSLRPDFIPEEFCEALKSLQSAVPPFDFSQVRAVVEGEWGRPIENLFRSFDREPVASASIAQVHRARLRSGEEVAVKVQRPGIQGVVEGDLDLLVFLADQVERFYPPSRMFRPKRAAREFAAYTRRELDFRSEARTARRFREQFAGDRTVKVPLVHAKLTTPRVLVMEFVRGLPFEDLLRKDLARRDRAEIALRGYSMVMRQVLDFGFFHADPHPGNLMLLKDNVICMLDFGMYGEVSESLKKRMLAAILFLLRGDFEATTRTLLGMAELDERADVEGFRSALHALYSEWFGSSIQEYSMALLFYRELSIGAKYGVLFPGGLILLARALMTIEAVGRDLDPEMDVARVGKPILERFFLRQFAPEKLSAELLRQAPEVLDFLERIPSMAMNIYRRLESGKIEVGLSDRALRAVEGARRTGSSGTVLSVLAGSLLIGGSLLHGSGMASGAWGAGPVSTWMLVAGVALGVFGLLRTRRPAERRMGS